MQRDFKQSRPSIQFAQNFFRDSNLVAALVAKVGLCKNDIVYEIGSGKGIITNELAQVCSQVVAIEIDSHLFQLLQARFQQVSHVKLIHADFLRLHLPKTEYKVFSNIPFNITAKLLKKLLFTKHPPQGSYLILQWEAAKKYGGINKESQVSLLFKPWFSSRIIYRFRRTDFYPVPNVDSVLLAIEKRNCPLVPDDKAATYRRFIVYGFGKWKGSLRKNFKKVFSYRQWKRLAHDLKFDLNAQPTDLTFEQWLALFKFFLLKGNNLI